MTENPLLIRSRRRAKASSCASEADGDATDLLNAARGGNLGPAKASIWRMPVQEGSSLITPLPLAMRLSLESGLMEGTDALYSQMRHGGELRSGLSWPGAGAVGPV
jgi:hypothetical protein